MFCHEDCLAQWLKHSNKDTCELCGHRFSFTPVYVPGAPQKLPVWQVLLTCAKKTVFVWIPFVVRIVLALLMWLVVVPLTTSCLYRLWIHKKTRALPATFIMQRLSLSALWSDCVAGIMIASAILLSFLSLMTFADFLADQILRDDWNFPPNAPGHVAPDVADAAPADGAHGGQIAQREEDLGAYWDEEGEHEDEQEVDAEDADDDRSVHDLDENLSTLRPRSSTHPPIRQSPGWLSLQRGSHNEDEFRTRENAMSGESASAQSATSDSGVVMQGPVIVPEVQRGRWHEGILGASHDSDRLGTSAIADGPSRSAPQTTGRVEGEYEDEDSVPGLELLSESDIDSVSSSSGSSADDEDFRDAPEVEEPVEVGGAQVDDMDMEVQLAVDELFGLRGPPGMLLRNILWLLGFNGAYLGIFAFIPYSVGSSMVSLCGKYLHLRAPWQSGSRASQLLAVLAAEEDRTLQLADLATICLGYAVMSSMVFSWRRIINTVCDRTAIVVLRRIRKVMKIMSAIVKVGVLLSLKMLFLPLLLGSCVDVATLSLFDATGMDRALFLSTNLAGSLLLHWVLGITFMLFVTVSVLQLREVVHPHVLACLIRPQEPHPSLLGSLLQESGHTHARRMAMSLSIYVVILFLFVWLPVRLLAYFLPSFLPIHLRFCYLVPQLQVPLEVVMFHLGMIAFLERYKNRIGNLQHLWLKYVSEKTGLTRYLLPLPVLSRRDQPDGQTAPSSSGLLGSDGQDGILEVGPPLVRPPPGWEDPAGALMGRWAWGNEPAGEEERNLAPRRRPKFLALPLCALLLLAWISILALSMSVVYVPFAVGRKLFTLLHVPEAWMHDPFGFAFGYALYRLSVETELGAAVVHFISAVVRHPPPSKKWLGLLGVCLTWFILTPLLLSSLFHTLFVLSAEEWAKGELRVSSLFGDYGLAVLLLNSWFYLCYAGFMNGLWPLGWWAQDDQGGNVWCLRARAVASMLQAVTTRGDWRRMSFKLVQFNFVLHVLHDLLVAGLISLAAASLAHLASPERFGQYFSVYQCSAYIGGIPLQSALQLYLFRAALVLCMCLNLFKQLHSPLRRWMKTMHDSLRDDRYLMGRKLQNHPDAAKKIRNAAAEEALRRTQSSSPHSGIRQKHATVA
jgi:hypothetical protein